MEDPDDPIEDPDVESLPLPTKRIKLYAPDYNRFETFLGQFGNCREVFDLLQDEEYVALHSISPKQSALSKLVRRNDLRSPNFSPADKTNFLALTKSKNVEGLRNLLNRRRGTVKIRSLCSIIYLPSRGVDDNDMVTFADALGAGAGAGASELGAGADAGADAGASQVEAALSQNTSITAIDFGVNRIHMRGVEMLAKALENNKHIRELNLNDNWICSEGVQSLKMLLMRQRARRGCWPNSTITSLAISHNGIGTGGAKHLAVLMRTDCLKRLEIAENKLFNVGIQKIASAIGNSVHKIKTLTYLDLSRNSFDERGAEYIGRALGFNRTLKSLILEGNQLKDAGAIALASGLNLHPMEELDLQHCSIGDAGALALAGALLKGAVKGTLKSLNLSGNWIGDTGAKALSPIYRNLRVMCLKRNRIGNKGAAELAKAICDLSQIACNLSQFACNLSLAICDLSQIACNLSQIAIVELGGNKIGAEGAEALAKAIISTCCCTSRLTILDLNQNLLCDEGAAHIAKALAVNKSITSLDLSINRIENKGAESLALALTTNTQLKILNLCMNQIGSVGIKSMATILTKCPNKTLERISMMFNEIGDMGADALTPDMWALESLNVCNNHIRIAAKSSLVRRYPSGVVKA